MSAKSASGDAGRKDGSPRVDESRSIGKIVVYCAAVLTVAGLCGLALAAPIRSLVAQNERMADVRAETGVLEVANADLRERIEDLGSDETIERRAREELGLVKPGEEVYVLVPPAGAHSTQPPTDVGDSQ